VADLSIRPANEVPWEDLEDLFGSTRDTRCCQCQRFKIGRWEWTPVPVADRTAQMRAETGGVPTTVPWKGRSEDKADETVWAVTCLFTRPGFRRRGVSAALADAGYVEVSRPTLRRVVMRVEL